VLLLIASFGALSGLYVLLDSPFAAVIQIVVYAGAILVLFLFVVMLLNAPHEDTEEDLERLKSANAAVSRLRGGPMKIGALLAAAFIVELLWALSRITGAGRLDSGAAATVSSVARIGTVLFTDYRFAFEVTSVLILVAMVGAVWFGMVSFGAASNDGASKLVKVAARFVKEVVNPSPVEIRPSQPVGQPFLSRSYDDMPVEQREVRSITRGRY